VQSNLNAAKLLYSQLLILVGAVIQNPTQANIDAAVSAINAGTYSGVVVPRLNYSLDGKAVSWDAYYAQLTALLKSLNELIQAEALPFVISSRARL
jgi:hypothetical protein